MLDYRKKLIKAIHAGKNSLGLTREEYVALVGSVCPGKKSCAELTIRELRQVLERMREVGFKPIASSQMNKIRALWHSMADEGIVRMDSDKALAAYIQRITRKAPTSCKSEDLSRVIETLKKWILRIENAEVKERLETEFNSLTLTVAR